MKQAMKQTIGAILGVVALGAFAAPASAHCINANRAYSVGHSVGREACNWAQLQWANSAVVTGARPSSFDRICDISGVLSCKAGFRDGFRSGRSQNIAGINVPSCSWLLDSNFGSTFRTFSQTQADLCNARFDDESKDESQDQSQDQSQD